MATVNVSAQHSKDRRHYNGLTDDDIIKHLIVNPHEPLLIVAVARRVFAKIDDRQGGAVTPTINLDWVECGLTDDDKTTIREILTRRLKERTGQTSAGTDFGPYEPAQAALFDEQGNPLDHTASEERDPAAGPWPGDADYPQTDA